MKRVLIGVFAHPDDEAFGPGGTLLKEIQAGTELHLICATRGESGVNPDNHPDLGNAREAEWHACGKLLGATTMTQLGYPDAGLSNRFYLEIADKIKAQVKVILSEHGQPIDLQFLTFAPDGLTGHLDHIAISMITTFVYTQLKSALLSGVSNIGLRYFCLSASEAKQPDTGWLYMPAGLPDEEIDERIDVSDVLDQKLRLIDTHASQREDAAVTKARGQALRTECFYYAK